MPQSKRKGRQQPLALEAMDTMQLQEIAVEEAEEVEVPVEETLSIKRERAAVQVALRLDWKKADGTNSYEGYSTAAGMGLPSKNYKPNPAYGYIVALRGNTNLTQAQLNAMDITTLMLDNSRLEQEVTGIMLSQSAQ